MELTLREKRVKSLLEDSRRLCQYATPDFVAELMVSWAIRSKDAVVLDPCSGNSTLLEKSMGRLVQLGATTSSAARNVYGVEINRKTIGVALSNLVSKFGASVPRFINKDFLLVDPDTTPRFTTLICNPPYKRHQELEGRYKDLIAEKIEKESGMVIPRTSGLYVHFLIHASRFLEDDGRMVFLTPSQYLDNKFGSVLRRFLTERFQIKALVLFDETLKVFPNSMSTACLILLQKTAPTSRTKTMLVKLNSIPTAQQLWSILEDKVGFSSARIYYIMQKQLQAEPKWTRLFSEDVSSGAVGHCLRDFAEIRRGVATGANEYFVLGDAEVKDLRLESRFLMPILAKAQYAPFYDFTTEDWDRLRVKGKRVWLLDCDVPKNRLRRNNVLRYIEYGETKAYHKRYLTSHRKLWYSQEHRLPSSIIFTYMSNGHPRFIYNKAKVVTLNTFHSIYPTDEISSDKKKLKALLAYLNSSYLRTRLRFYGRTYSGGLLKIEPNEMGRIPTLDLNQLEEAQLAELARLFDKMCHACRRTGEPCNTGEIDEYLSSISTATPLDLERLQNGF